MPNSTPEVIRINGTIYPVLPEDGVSFSLEELQVAVGGHIEMVALFDGRMMVLNEEGKLLNLPVNQVATGLFNHPPRAWFDPICGQVLVCYANWLGGDDDDDDDEPEGDDDDNNDFEYADDYDSLRESEAEDDDSNDPALHDIGGGEY